MASDSSPARIDAQPLTRREDYRPSDYLIDTIDLEIRLHPASTTVRSILRCRPNPSGAAGAPLVLDGDELAFRGLDLDGDGVPPGAFEATPGRLTLFDPPRGPFALTIRTEINPSANTKLMGLYRSSGIYCTQCEADGFRRITYALDRPDVLSVHTTRIEADRDEAPTLLGNGNLVETGPIGQKRHFAVWHDPFPKPPYLFAIVGGRLAKLAKSYVTSSGRDVEIAIHVEPGKETRAEYALDALERSMRWDERVFGREYDLDVFNVVAVSDFNMGAMENKGLNIFNDKYVLASPDVATDTDYAGIEAVIAHEYFHNWTGNRITCRDWFQLCLKEGLTVFRDQEFSSDERSRAVHRVGEVRTLRARQFSEDAGPLSHPVRPNQYREINNFYTATVYEKGAEIVRMLKTLLGADVFAAGMDRFFKACDGTAATVEDFLGAFAVVSGRDLLDFARWYDQAGTPTVTVDTAWDDASGTIRLAFHQETPPTPGQPEKGPLVLPIALGMLSPAGRPIEISHPRVRPDGVFVMDGATDSLTIGGVLARPVPSLFRGFSAPVRVRLDLTDHDLLTLLEHDPDPFNRWQSAQTAAMRLLTRRVAGDAGDREAVEPFCAALDACLTAEASRDPAFAAVILTMPGEIEIAQEIGSEVDPDRIRTTLIATKQEIGRRLADPLKAIRRSESGSDAYSPDATSAGERALRNVALDLLSAGDRAFGQTEAVQQFEGAANMTDRLAALAVLALIPGQERERALATFGARYFDEPLVLDKWFALQASVPEPGTLDRVRSLMEHPGFMVSNPNRVRALIGGFALGNATQFHRIDGEGYRFLAQIVLDLNEANPQVAARLLTAFSSWRMMEARRRVQARSALELIARAENLSPDVADIVGRSLAEKDNLPPG